MFAGDSTVTVRSHQFGKHYFTEAVIDRVRVEASDADGEGALLIGVSPGTWYKADNFQLYYVGSLESGDDNPDIIMETRQVATRHPKGIYTIQGQRVERISKPGIYIIDGKKMVVR